MESLAIIFDRIINYHYYYLPTFPAFMKRCVRNKSPKPPLPGLKLGLCTQYSHTSIKPLQWTSRCTVYSVHLKSAKQKGILCSLFHNSLLFTSILVCIIVGNGRENCNWYILVCRLWILCRKNVLWKGITSSAELRKEGIRISASTLRPKTKIKYIKNLREAAKKNQPLMARPLRPYSSPPRAWWPSELFFFLKKAEDGFWQLFSPTIFGLK